MASKIETFVRTVRGLTEDDRFREFDDPHGLLAFDKTKLEVYRTNPYLTDLDQPCQLIGVKDGRVVGRRNSYPSRIVVDGVVYNTRISGSVYVDPACRSGLYALSMLRQALKFPEGDLNINCWLSDQNKKFYSLIGSAMFPIVEFDAGGRWNRFYKGGNPPGWKKYAAKILNAVVEFSNHFFDRSRWRDLPAWTVREIPVSDYAFLVCACDLIKNDRHRFRQEITPEWIKWALTTDFSFENNRGRMFGVFDGKTLVGFALTRENPRTRSRKIYEWQLDEKYEEHESDFLSVIARRLYYYGVKIRIQVREDEKNTVEELVKRFPLVGRNYAVVTMSETSRFKDVVGFKDMKNWRVRPGMGDAAHWCA